MLARGFSLEEEDRDGNPCFFELARAESDEIFERGLVEFKELGFDLRKTGSNGRDLLDALTKGKLSSKKIDALMASNFPVKAHHAEALFRELNKRRAQIHWTEREAMVKRVLKREVVEDRIEFLHAHATLQSEKPRGWASRVNKFVAKEIAAFL